MEGFRSVADSIPFLKSIGRRVGIDPAYCLIMFVIVSAIVIQKTVIGNFYACILSLYLPIREAILSIQSPTPKAAEQKKLLTVFIAFSAFTILEALGIRQIVPLFLILKVFFIFWLTYDERHSTTFSDVVLKGIPQDWLHYGDTIDSAVKKAAKAVEDKIDISVKKGSIEITKK